MNPNGDEYRRHDDDCSLAHPCSTCEAEELKRYEADEKMEQEFQRIYAKYGGKR